MSAPAVRRHCYDEAVEAELAHWPGVTVRREHRGKHLALILTFNGVSRFVTYPTSPGDVLRGPKNHVSNVRQALRGLGAKRDTEPKSVRPSRRRKVRVEARAKLVRTEPLTGRGPERDPFAVLASLKIEPKKPEPWWVRAWKWVRGRA